MTLCIAWRDKDGRVCLASDSRVTVAKNSFQDIAVKVTRIPCEIFPPSSDLVNGEGIVRISLGMAFSGSHLGAYVVKESLVEVLSRLQFVPGVTEISMDKIVKIAFYAYEKLSKRLCSTILAKKGTCEIFLAGFCPMKKIVRAFRLTTNTDENTYSYAEILNAGSQPIELSGTGSNALSLRANLNSNPLQALKDVIDDPTRDDVEGALQYGVCSSSDFQIFCEYLIDENDQPTYMRAGLDINKIIYTNENDLNDLFISPNLIDLNK